MIPYLLIVVIAKQISQTFIIWSPLVTRLSLYFIDFGEFKVSSSSTLSYCDSRGTHLHWRISSLDHCFIKSFSFFGSQLKKLF
jgi:hypothetical protein